MARCDGSSDELDESARLVRSAFAGDETSMSALIDRLLPVIRARAGHALSRSLGRRLKPDEGKDLVQDVWLALIDRGGKQLCSYDPSRGVSLEVYVGLLVERQATKLILKQLTLKRGGGQTAATFDETEARSPPSVCPELSLAAAELAKQLDAHLSETLSERGLLILRYLVCDGRSPENIAQILGVNVQVVYNWQFKIRSIAREFIDRVTR